MEGTVDLSLPLAFTVGLFSSLHCIGMCGGIIGALSYGLSPEVRRQAGRMAIYLLALSAGRVLSYALAGALLGSMGEVLQGVAGSGQVHLWLRWAAALIMVLIGMHIAGWLPRLAMIERLGVPLWARLEPLGRRLMPVQTPGRAVAYGMLWGWLPCGLVYTMLLSAVGQTGAVGGAVYMLVFGLGTLPGVLLTGLLAGKLYQFARRPYLREMVGSLVMLMGLVTLWVPVNSAI
ncbi:MAG: hypothetical protein C3L25_00290 [Candidatus Sedimenticola endophacoides]|uniref:Urease accessory protein UreH-like transmembrane domain-containing protein n=1 Tax=Candidatus Sedimenticola endophacoides TaxID=2548426 RepID=A0A6N4DT63_9GAMM|nr:MAG: hypothetical protein C3L24_04985 [Candidatus Sedimenticola endophacoides]PUE05600.1 MAG: hypothetical protein C3L25_00290 [Candidatus Sedimenticola endophacoides]